MTTPRTNPLRDLADSLPLAERGEAVAAFFTGLDANDKVDSPQIRKIMEGMTVDNSRDAVSDCYALAVRAGYTYACILGYMASVCNFSDIEKIEIGEAGLKIVLKQSEAAFRATFFDAEAHVGMGSQSK